MRKRANEYNQTRWRHAIKRVVRLLSARESRTYALIGLINACNVTALSAILVRWMPYQSAYALGYAGMLLIAYRVNARFTFFEKPTLRRMLLFMLAYIPKFLIQTGAVVLLVEQLGIRWEIAFVLANLVGVPLTFCAKRGLGFYHGSHSL